jgi:hypothetical protein
MSLGLRSDITRAFVQDARILTLIADVVKPGIAIYSGKLTTKLPHLDLTRWDFFWPNMERGWNGACLRL